ncbi:MAG TPA: EDSAP-1 family PEP-CTERM protein [Casimicrobiaceae bacterium]|jgi:hypothetical protein
MRLIRIARASSVVAGLLLLLSSAVSHASVIAIALDDLANFTAFGFTLQVLGAPGRSQGATAASFGATSVTNSADCPAPPGPCNPGNLTANPVQSTAGPGAFPGEDDYTQPPAGGFEGSRGDGNVGLLEPSSSPVAILSQNVAESRLNSAGSIGGATGSSTAFENLTINGATGQSTPITFSFTADPFMQLSVAGAGDTAAAVLSTALTLTDAGGTTVFQYVPGGTGIGIASETTPFTLNTTLLASSPTDNTTFDPSEGTFSVTTVNLLPGSYTLSLQTSAVVRAAQGAVTTVPEPSTLLLVASVLVLAGALRSRRS